MVKKITMGICTICGAFKPTHQMILNIKNKRRVITYCDAHLSDTIFNLIKRLEKKKDW